MKWSWWYTFEPVKRVVFVAHGATAKDADANIRVMYSLQPGYHDTSGTPRRRV